MRNLLVLAAAASVLALGISTYQAAAIFPGANDISPERTVLKVQKNEEKGPGARGQDTGSKGGEPGVRDGSGKGGGAAQDKGDRGTQMRSGDKGARAGQRSTDVDVNVERGRRGDTADRRTAGADTADGMSMSTCGAMAGLWVHA